MKRILFLICCTMFLFSCGLPKMTVHKKTVIASVNHFDSTGYVFSQSIDMIVTDTIQTFEGVPNTSEKPQPKSANQICPTGFFNWLFVASVFMMLLFILILKKHNKNSKS